MRVLLVVIDSFGIGSLPDADRYGDQGANTVLSICEAVQEVNWPVLEGMGLGNCAGLLGVELPGCPAVSQPRASFGVMAEASGGKDTTTGHWELAGIILDEPFRTFPLASPSFPDELIGAIMQQTEYGLLGNVGASGTAIIEDLGAEHLRGGGLIVYTSADSVLQIAAHEELVPPAELYRICEQVRTICDPYRIGRVIARPFIGKPGAFQRTANRRDFSMRPPGGTILDVLQAEGVETVAIGKIGDIFCEQGITTSYHDSGNADCMRRMLACLREKQDHDRDRFFFINLVDTDMHYGHRRDIEGYHDAVARIDEVLAETMALMDDEDLLIVTADHGCDPGFKGTDHTREYVPLLAFSKSLGPQNLGVRGCFCDVAASVASWFGVQETLRGTSFLEGD